MALVEENTLRVSLKRFPRDVREELNKIVHRGSWQKLTREFSVDTYTGLEAEALDFIPDIVDNSYSEFREDVKMRLKFLKKIKAGKAQSFKGKSKVGFHSYFYRYTYFYAIMHSYRLKLTRKFWLYHCKDLVVGRSKTMYKTRRNEQ